MERPIQSYSERVSITPSLDPYERCNACGSNDKVFLIRVGIMTIAMCKNCCSKMSLDINRTVEETTWI